VEKITIADSTALALPSTFTIEAWIRPTTTDTEAIFLDKRQSYALGIRNGLLMYQLDSVLTGTRGIWFNTGLAVQADRWTHVALVKDGTTIRVHLNGVQEYARTSAALDEFDVSYGIPLVITATSNPLTFGTDNRGFTPYNGKLSDVRIWGSARSASLIAATYNLRFASDIGTWFLDETSGTTAYNSAQTTSSVLNGTYTGTTSTIAVPTLGARLDINDTPDFEAWLPAWDAAGGVTFAADALPTLGTFTITNAATGAFTYRPDLNANGLDAFSYTASAGSPTSDPETFNLRIYDTSRPIVTEFTTSSGLWNHAADQTYALTFAESVSGLAGEDFSNTGTATGCTFDPGTDGDASRTVTVSGCSEGTLIPHLAADAVADAVGNTGPVTQETGPTINIDRTAPSISAFTTTLEGETNATALTWTLTFSEAVTGVASGDFTNTGSATGCSFAPGTDTGDSRTVVVTGCSNGTFTPRFAVNGANDLSGTTGPSAAMTASTTLTLDTVVPASFGTLSRLATNNPTITVSYTASDTGTLVTVDAYYSENLTLTNPMQCGQRTSSAGSGTVACDLPAVHPVDGSISTDGVYYVWTQATDSAGNGEPAPLSADAQIRLDRVPPTLDSFVTTSSTLTAAATLTYTMTWSEAVTQIGAGDFRNAGSAAGCVFNPGTDAGSTRTVTLTGCGTGTVSPRFAATEASDAAGNLGPGSEVTATPTVTIDRAAPVLGTFAVAGTEGVTLFFSPSSFASTFTDDRVVEPASITIKTLPSSGTLMFSGSAVTVNQVLPYHDLGSLSYVPAVYINGTYTFTATASDGANSSTPATTISIQLAPVTNDPVLTRIDPLAGANEDQSFTITYLALQNASDATAYDSTLRFRIESILAGSVTKGGVAVTPGTTSIGPGESFVWNPPANAYGLLSAFTVRAFDGTSISPSAITVQAQVAAQVCSTTDTTASGWLIRQFTALGECTWVAPAGISTVQAFVVGGGGGGGSGIHTYGSTYYTGGGGGAGGMVVNNAFAVSTGSSYRVTVGAGGSVDQSGGGSVFGSVSVSGGGYGGIGATGSTTATLNGIAGGLGGSGGGGGAPYNGTAGTGGTGTAGQGSNGTTAATGTGRVGGAGGGASGTSAGSASSFTGTATTYARGGSGRGTAAAQATASGTGNGGSAYGDGSNGVVMIRWPTATPTISAIAGQGTNSNTTLSGVAFTVGDADNTAGTLTVSATSSNTTVVPNANVTFGGSGASRTLSIVPATGQSGTSTITVSVTDGASIATSSFVFTVGDLVKPVSSGAITATYTASTNVSVVYTASDVGGLASIRAYYSTLGTLASPVLCGTVTSAATSGTITCALPATQGTYYVFTRATDAAGNVEDAPVTADDTIGYDTIAPASVLSIVTTQIGTIAVANIAITVTDAGQPASGTIYYSTSSTMSGAVSCGTWTSISTSLTNQTCTLPAIDGTYYLAARAVDTAGNLEPMHGTADDSIILDRVAPTSTGAIAATLTNNVSLPVTYTAADTNTIQTVTAWYSTSSTLTSPVQCGSVSSAATSGTITCTLPATNATYYVYTRGTDLAGNVEAAPASGSADDSIVLDVVAPAASVPDLNAASDSGTSSTDNITSTTTPAFTVSPYDAGATTTVTATTAGATSVTCTAVAATCTLSTLADGVWTISAAQTDPAGNVSVAGSTLSVKIDNSAPVVTSFVYSTGVTGGVQYTLSFDEDVTGLTTGDVSLGGTATGWTVTSVAGSAAGPYTLTFSGSNRGTMFPTLASGGVTNVVSITGPTTATAGGTSTAQEPWLSALPSISMNAITGSSQTFTLAANDGTWVGIPGGTVTRTWQYSANSGTTWVDYGSTASTISPANSYSGNQFRTVVTYTNVHGTAIVASPAQVFKWFLATGAEQTWAVPAGATSIAFDLAGGKGGEMPSSDRADNDLAGLGGRVQGTLTGVAGTTLRINVGGAGGTGYALYGSWSGGVTIAGGFNGGGSTYMNSCSSGSWGRVGGGGGGATDVRTGANLTTRLVVAGGGGGDGTSIAAGTGRSGNGGGLIGQSGFEGATGGTQSAGGLPADGGSYGQSGSLGVGGSTTNCFGGGGGGGYYGGGAGGVWYNGAGGSSYTNPANVPDPLHTQGYGGADRSGFVVFTYPVAPASKVMSIDPHLGPISGRFPLTFSVSFSAEPVGLTLGDFATTGTATGWDVTSLVGYGLGPYMITVSPNGSETEGTVGIALAAEVVTVDGVSAPTALQDSTSKLTIDLTPPSVTSFTTSSLTPTNAASLTYTLTLNSTATGIVVADFSNAGTAAGCTFGVTGSGATRTVTVSSCGEGTVVPRFTPSATVDAYANPMASVANDGRSTLIDRTAPAAPSTPDLLDASDTGQLTTDDLTNLTTQTFSIGNLEPDASAVITATQGATTRTCAITSAGITAGTASCVLTSLTAGVWSITARQTDFALTLGVASTALSVTVDTTAPTASWTTLPANPVTGTSAAFGITFSEAVYSVASADFSNASNATGCAYDPGADTGATRTVTVDSCADGGLALRFAAAGAKDLAGNVGPASAITTSTIAMRKLYDFTTHTFTPCGTNGTSGPAQSTCAANYGTTWSPNATLYTVSGGIQYWRVPVTGTYEIAAAGAGGGGLYPGGGIVVQGRVSLVAGQILKILVGQTGGAYGNSGGGGGGSFVTTTANTPIIVAGGGGGGGWYGSSTYSGVDGSRTTSGTSGTEANPGAGGTAGGAGSRGSSGYGYGGAGLTGTASGYGSQALAFTAGGTGSVGYGGSSGGFGGGGSAYIGGGGGGGYSGGGGAGVSGLYGGGGGGGSFTAADVAHVVYLSTTDFGATANRAPGYVTFRMARQVQTVTFPAPAAMTYGDGPQTLAATSDADLTVSYFSLTTAVCTVGSDQVTIVKSGTCTIRAYNTGNATNDADTAEQSFVITKAPITITASAPTLNYGDAVPTITALYAGLQYSDTASTGFTTLPTCTTAYTVFAVVASAPSTSCRSAVSNKYSITYADRTVTINQRPVTLTALSHTVAFGGAIPTITFALANMANSETSTAFSAQPTCTTTYQDGDVPGTVNTTSCAGAVATNYSFSFVGGTVTTNAKVVTVTASSDTRVYGDPSIPAPTPSYEGWENGDTLAALTTPASCTTAYTANSTVPAGAATSCSGAVAPNYSFTYVAGRITVTKRFVTVTASDGTTTYGTSAPSITPIYGSEFVNGQTSSVVSSMSCLTAWSATTSVGSTPRSYCQNGTATNYQFTYVDGVVSVTQKPVAVTASSPSVIYGSAVPTITASYVGLVNGNTQANSFTTAPTCTTVYTVDDVVGAVPATTCSGAVAQNYSFSSYTDGAVTITKRTISVRATSHTVTYGDPKPTISVLSYTGWVNGQDQTSAGVAGITCNSAAYLVTTATTIVPSTVCTGGTAANYQFSYPTGTITIQAKQLNVTASNASVQYGDGLPTITASYSGWVNGGGTGNLTTVPRCTSPYAPTTAVAETPPVAMCFGGTATNYSFNYIAGAVTISQKPVVITASSPTVTYGDLLATVRVLPSVSTTLSPISGMPLALNGNDGAWTGDAGETATRQWQQSTNGGTTWTDIASATAATYTPAAADSTSSLKAFRLKVVWTKADTSTMTAVSIGRIWKGFTYTGGTQTWTVPAGVSSATFDLVGARGGTLGYGTGGDGGRVQGTLPVTAASSLTITVGGTTFATTAGYNGAARGYSTGAGGGGATDIRQGGTAVANRVFVAGGGGGDGGTNGSTPYGNHGGRGGGVVAGAGSAKTAPNSTYYGGGGGTQAAGGVVGSYGGTCGGAGSLALGGIACSSSGGGGGGGYYGGGGGYYNGGGGGSSYAVPSATGVNHIQGYDKAITNGYATVAYTVSAATTLTVAVDSVAPIFTLQNYETASVFTTRPTCTTTYTVETRVAAVLADRITECSGAEAANYSFSYVSGGVTVQRKGVVVTASNASVTYGDARPTITPSYVGWRNDQTETVLTTVPTCTTPYLPTTTVAAGSTTTCSGAVADDYSFTYTPGTVAVARKPATITASDSTVTYGDPIPVITPAYSGLVNGETSGIMTTVPTCSTTYTVQSIYGTTPTTTCAAGAAANYTFTYFTGVVNIQKKEIVVVASSPTVTYGANVPAITASYSGWRNGQTQATAGVVSEFPVCSSTYQNTDSILTVPVSSCVNADALNYFFSYTSGIVTIIRKNINVTASSDTAVYGDASIATPTPSYTGWVNGEGPGILTADPTCTSTYSSSRSVAAGAASSCVGAAAANYSFTYYTGVITVTLKGVVVTASNATVSYGSAPPSISPNYSGFVNGQNSSVVSNTTCGSNYTTSVNVADTPPTTTCTNAAAANYSFTYVSGYVTVNQRQVVVTATSPTVFYGEAVPTISFTLGNMANGQTSSVFSTQPTCVTVYTTSDTVAMRPATFCSGAVAANYYFTYTAGQVTIQPAVITITASSHTREYGSTDIPAPTPSFVGWVSGNDETILSTQPTCSTTHSTASTVAAGAATSCAGAVGGNYNFSYVNGVVAVTRATLNVTASSVPAIVYGAAVPTITPSYTGFKNSQGSGVVSATTCSTTYTTTRAYGQMPTTTCAYATAANYQFTYTSGTVTIIKRTITVTAPNPTVTYGDAVPSTTPIYTGYVNNQGLAAFDTEATCTTPYTVLASVAATASDRAITCVNATALNYDFAYVNGVITVQKKQLMVTATSHTVTYGDPKPTVTPLSYTGWRNLQDETTVAITGLTCNSATYAISSSATTTPSTDCAGATAIDYSFAYTAGAITITTKSLTITASSPSVTYGDPVPAITAGYDGLANTETSANLTTAARCITAYTVTSSATATPATSCWGATSPNYAISYTDGTVAISRKAITITAANQTVTYGDTTTTLQVLPTVDNAISPSAATPLTLQANDGIWTGVAGEATSRVWQYSTNAGATWNAISPSQTGTTYTPPLADLTTRSYRVVVTYTELDASTVTVATAGRKYAVFANTGAQQTWTVPAGVTSATVGLVGARGGQLASATSSGGLGGRVQGVVTVVPAAAVYVYVGATTATTTAGYNGGGTGYSTGSGGGGATDIRSGGSALANRILVAGGGGGSGGTEGGTTYGNHGGVGGGLVAAAGSAKTQTNAKFYGGGGGTQAAGGEAGQYGASTCAAAGTLGNGGAGCSTTSGGGGGGGYYGGGGGHNNGGGGGSSYAAGSVANAKHRAAYATATGNGYAVIAYDVSIARGITGAVGVVSPSYTLLNFEDQTALLTKASCTTPYTYDTVVAADAAARITQCSGADATNYSFSYATGSITVQQKNVNVTASSHTVTYGDAKPTITPSYVGWTNSQDANALATDPTCSTTYATTTSAAAVAANRTTSCIGAVADNYSFTYFTGLVTVQKKNVDVTASSPTVNYADAVPTISPSYSGFINGATTSVVSGMSCTTTFSSTTSDVGTTPTTACTSATATDYSFTYFGGTVTINQRPITITASSHTVAYGDAVPTVTPLYTLANSQTSTALSTQPTCVTTYGTTTHVAAVLADRTTSCSAAVALNYSFSYTTGAVTINQKGVTVTGSSTSVTYGDPAPEITPIYAGFVNAQDSTILTTQPSCTTAYGTTTAVNDTATLRRTYCSGASAADYSFTYPLGYVTVGKKNVDVTARDYTVNYGDAKPTILADYVGFINSATSTVIGGQTCSTTYTTTTDVAAVLANRTTSCVGGTATNYSFTYFTGAVTVNQRPVTITASSHSVTYGAGAPTITPSVTLVSSQTLATVGVMTTQPTCSTTYSTTTHVAAVLADRSTSCTGAVAANYSFLYTSGAVTIGQKGVTVTGSSPSVTYGDAIPEITPIYAGFVNAEDWTILTTQPTCSTVYLTTTSAAASATNRRTNCVGAVAADYSFTYPTGLVAVGRKTVYVTASSSTVNYADTIPTITASYSGLINGALSTVVTGQTCSTTYSTSTNVGVVPTTSCTGGTATDYLPAYIAGTVTINQRPVVITASSHSVFFGAAVPTITAAFTLANSQTALTAGVMTTQPSCATTYTTTTPVAAVLADRTTSCSGAVANNYSFTYTASAVTISQKPVTITASSPSVTYGDAIPTITPSYTAFAGTDTASILTTPPTCSTTYSTTTSFGVTLTTTCATAVAANYAFSYTGGTVTIAKKGVVITAASVTPTYGDAIPTITPNFSGFVNGQTQATAGVMTTQPTCSTTYTAATTVAAGGTTSCASAVANNYSFSYTAGTATVQRKLVTIAPTSPTVTYGDAIPTITVLSYTGWVNSQTQATVGLLKTTPTCSTTYLATSPVATTPATSCAGAAADNYEFSYTLGTVTIARKAATITASSPTRTFGDAVPTVTPIYGGMANSEDGASIVTTAPVCTTTYVSTSAFGTLPTTTCASAVATNYTFTFPTGAVTIARKQIAVTASSPVVTYGDAIPTITPTYSDFANSDTAAVVSGTTCTTTYVRTAGVALSPPTTCSGSTAANYSFTFVASTVTIQRATLTITASSAVLTHGDPVPTVAPGPVGLRNGASLAVVTGQSCSTAYTRVTNAGNAPWTRCTGGSADNYNVVYVEGLVTVRQASVSIGWTSLAAITYETPLSSTQISATAHDAYRDVSGEGRFDYSVGGTAMSIGDVLPAGTHTLNVVFTPDNGTSYAGAARTVTLVVNRAPQSLVVGAVATTRTYGQSTTLTAGSHSGTGAVSYHVEAGPCEVTGATLQTTGAGTCQVSAAIAFDANYLQQTSNQLAITVNQAPLSVTAANQHRRRGHTDPALTHLVTGFVRGDNENVLTSPVSLTRAPGETPGEYAITASGAAATNYSFSYTPGIVTIIEKDFATISWPTPTTMTYGTLLSSAHLNPSAAFDSIDVPGTYAFDIGGTAVTAGTLLPAGGHVVTATFTPTDTANFQSGLTQQVVITAQRKPLTVSGVTAADRSFDETTTAQVTTTAAALVGVVGVDDVRLEDAFVTAAFGDATVGEAKTVTVAGLALAGTDIDNYTLVQPTTTARIRGVAAGRPTGATATAGDRSATVEWSAPEFTGGGRIVAYTVTASPGGQTCAWTTGPLTCSVAGLTNGTAYTFSMIATNAFGDSLASSASGSVAPAAPMAASVDSVLDAGLTVLPDGTIEVDLGCAGMTEACSVKVTMIIDGKVVSSGSSTSGRATQDVIILRLPPELQRKLARNGTLTVKIIIEVSIGGFSVKISSMVTLEAPPAQVIKSLELKPTANGGADLGARCLGTTVQRCSGELALYAEPAVLNAVSTRAQKRVLIGSGPFGGAAGEGVDGGAKLTAEGRAYLQQHGSMRVIPVFTFKGGTRLGGTLPKGFSLTMLNSRDWLKRAILTLSVGGRPRLDLNLLLDDVGAGKVSHREAARRIDRQIIPRRLAARAQVDALPVPPQQLQRVVTLLDRSFAQSLAANRAYIRWLKSGQASDPIGWRYSLKATATKQELIALLTKLSAPHGLRIPPASGLWP